MGTLADLERVRATWQAASLDAPLGLSRSRVQQIESKALGKLRGMLT